jgi:hypothetical protein
MHTSRDIVFLEPKATFSANTLSPLAALPKLPRTVVVFLLKVIADRSATVNISRQQL